MKKWHAGALAGGATGLFLISRAIAGRRKRWPVSTSLGSETEVAWTEPSAEPGIIPISGPTLIPIPSHFQQLGLTVAGASPTMMRARILFTPKSPVKYWLQVVPKQSGTTTLGIVAGGGPVAHVALQQEVA